MTNFEKDSASGYTKIAVYIFVLFASVITSIDGFFVVQTYISIEADGARKIASIAQGLVIVLIGPLFFGASGFFPEYKKSFNLLGCAGIFISIVMMALSQSSSDITAVKTAAKSAKVREIIETKIKNDAKKAEQMQMAAEKLNQSKEAWHHVLATRTLNASSAPANSIDSSIKDLKSEKESTPLGEIVGESWMVFIRIVIAVLMNLVHAVLMHTAFDLLRKSFGVAPIGQQILDAIHKISASGHGQQEKPAPQTANNGLITLSLTTASNDASAVNTVPAVEAARLKMPNWFKTIFKAGAATTAPLAGAGQFPLPEPVHAISVQDTQDRAAITLKAALEQVQATPVDTLKSVREEQSKEPVKAPVLQALELVSIEAKDAPADTLKSVSNEQPKEPVLRELELVSIDAKNALGDTLESVQDEQPAKAEKVAQKARVDLDGVQVDTGTKYPFNFRYLRIKKLVKKGLKPTVESIKVSDVPCGQDVATRYRDALVEDGVIERNGRSYVLSDKYQKLLNAKSVKK